jgi:NAD(P)-dependent dehydrogenase (short-subunit alcohol dehydrogenase family)
MNPVENDFSASLVPTIAPGHSGRPEEIAAAMAFIASPAVFSSTSTTLTIDEGHLASSLSRTTENKGEWKDESYSI